MVGRIPDAKQSIVGTVVVALWLATIATAAQPSSDSAESLDAAVGEALLRGFEGDVAAREQGLRKVLSQHPEMKLAHWHLGEIRRGDEWMNIDEAERRIASNPTFIEYRSMRKAAGGNPEKLLQLAGWCWNHRWRNAAEAHWQQVLSHPGSEEMQRRRAREKLGLQLYHGSYLSKVEIAAIEQELASRRVAEAKWIPVINKWVAAIESDSGRRQRYAYQQLRSLDNPDAVAPLIQIAAVHSADLGQEVVAVLAAMPDFEATEGLVQLALESSWDVVRSAATVELGKRPLHDFAPLVLQRLEAPIESRFVMGVGADGLVRRQHEFKREGQTANHVVTDGFIGGPQAIPMQRRTITGARRSGKRGEQARKELRELQIDRFRKLQEAAMVRRFIFERERLKAVQIEQQVAHANTAIMANNDRAYAVLEATTGEAIKRTPSSWWSWWQDYNETYREQKPTYRHRLGSYDPYYIPWTQVTLISCFPAGTLVRSTDGLVPIETLQIGDQVLSQDLETGELTYKLVRQTTLRPPSEMLTISFQNGSSITTTKGHPFWVNELGWRMAKRLHPGQQLHSIGGGLTVTNIEPAQTAQAHNLVVEDFATYFVGQAGVLVHDNTSRQPTVVMTPGWSPHGNDRSKSFRNE